MGHSLIARIAALAAPPVCVLCRTASPPGATLCGECDQRIRSLPTGRDDGTVFAAFPYAGPVRGLVAALKFRGAAACAQTMAELMASRLPPWIGSADAIVPVPAHGGRRRSRGFNQAELLGRALAREHGIALLDCLGRSPGGPPQSELSRAGRLALPPSAFRVERRRLRQRGGDSLAEFPTNVVLCDDVVTTGVTLEVCAQAIRDQQPGNGTGPIRAIVFASAGGRG